MAPSRASTTRRTLHYFWLVTRKHLGLFATLMTVDVRCSWRCCRTATPTS